MDNQWYTIFCKPHKELQVAKYLKANNIQTYHPTLRVNPVNPRASKIKSFFPRYLFVYADLDNVDIRRIQSAPGAVGLVEFGGEPAVVSEEFIAALKTRIAEIKAAGGLNLDGLEQGDPVFIRSGAFEGYDAIFDTRLSDDMRVQVLLHWLGREVKVKVDSQHIEKRRRRRKR